MGSQAVPQAWRQVAVSAHLSEGGEELFLPGESALYHLETEEGRVGERVSGGRRGGRGGGGRGEERAGFVHH